MKYISSKSAFKTFVGSLTAEAFSKEVDLEDDLFALGLDLIKSTEIVRNLKTGIGSLSNARELDWISLDLIYRHPSIAQLSEVLFQFFNSDVLPSDSTDSSTQKLEAISETIAAYTKNLPEPTVPANKSKSRELNIALTGSNGALGVALLQHIIGSGTKAKIYGLNRRQDEGHEAKYSSRVLFLKVQLHEH